MGPRGGPAGPSAQEADLLKLQKQLMEKQAMLQRALANGKRAGGGAATSVGMAAGLGVLPASSPVFCSIAGSLWSSVMSLYSDDRVTRR